MIMIMTIVVMMCDSNESTNLNTLHSRFDRKKLSDYNRKEHDSCTDYDRLIIFIKLVNNINIGIADNRLIQVLTFY